MADETTQDNEVDKNNSGMAGRYVRRARKLLASEEEGSLDQAQTYIGLANVHATLELAEALKQKSE